ncbi:hypothetical protein [Jannaschia sp. M317]|uniref:hypothetical protein n=1 Tax=Jannaschia sp. M317 TaxID=2867011 RepID=UPI0021A8139C|nr:hypothetical protein [Jannaschia sp. M317]UWQ18235.1 hypothetical protein K3551_02705 [Jannaschia sp. M317]
MTDPTQARLPRSFAALGIAVGVLSVAGGLFAAALALGQGEGVASGPGALATRALPAALLIALGLSLMLRGVHMRLTLEVLSLLRMQSRPTPIRAPAPRVTPEETPATYAPSSTVPGPAKRRVTPAISRASTSEPIKGKPFEPHPIFMARPPK